MVSSTLPRQGILDWRLAVLKKANDEILEWKLMAAHRLQESSDKWVRVEEVMRES
jgi:hypothetical protein